MPRHARPPQRRGLDRRLFSAYGRAQDAGLARRFRHAGHADGALRSRGHTPLARMFWRALNLASIEGTSPMRLHHRFPAFGVVAAVLLHVLPATAKDNVVSLDGHSLRFDDVVHVAAGDHQVTIAPPA